MEEIIETDWAVVLCKGAAGRGETASYLVTSYHGGGEFITMPLNSQHANLLYIEGAH